jgi:hypothetical protein
VPSIFSPQPSTVQSNALRAVQSLPPVDDAVDVGAIQQMKSKLLAKAKALKLSQQKNRRLKKLLESQEDIIRTLKNRNIEANAVNFVETGCSGAIAAIISFGKKRQVAYPEVVRNFALLFNLQSPRGYKLLRQHFTLPTTRTLRNWMKHVKPFPGFTNFTLWKLGGESVKRRDDRETNGPSVQNAPLVVSLVFDEMKISPGVDPLLVDGDIQHFGFVDTGKGPNGTDANDSTLWATDALVMMAVGINSQIRAPIYYGLVKGGMPGEEKAEIVMTAIRYLREQSV